MNVVESLGVCHTPCVGHNLRETAKMAPNPNCEGQARIWAKSRQGKA
jgi:hypothetical protein